jgi:hypothetical protein
VTLPSKEELLERERRWLKPAGLIAIAGALVFTASVVLTRAGLPFPNTNAEQLALYHDHSGRLLMAQVVGSVGFALFAAPLYVLFQAAAGRAERMRRGLVGLVLLGPLVFGLQGIVLSVGLSDASDKFAAQAPSVEQKASQEAVARQADEGKSPAETKAGEQAQTTTTGTSTTGTTTTATSTKTPEEAADDARDDLATDLIQDSSTVRTARWLGLATALSLLVGAIYTVVWAIRTGLLTRLWGMLGVIFVAALVLVPPIGPVGTVLWFGALGLMFVGRWVRPLPPAWAAGVAIPWPIRGQEPMPASTVEGSGREVSETPLPEEEPWPQGEPEAGETRDQEPGETQGQRRKKRKRRG